jgi:hypothetical protein
MIVVARRLLRAFDLIEISGHGIHTHCKSTRNWSCTGRGVASVESGDGHAPCESKRRTERRVILVSTEFTMPGVRKPYERTRRDDRCDDDDRVQIGSRDSRPASLPRQCDLDVRYRYRFLLVLRSNRFAALDEIMTPSPSTQPSENSSERSLLSEKGCIVALKIGVRRGSLVR